MKITGAEAICKSLIAEGVDTIFGYPGGAIMPFYDALYSYTDQIRHILVRHEQGGAHAAEGYAYQTGKPGVVIATSGPGATNLVTGIADAMLDSVAMVCITGQVPSKLVGTDAFQEVDVIGITTPITKWNYQVTKAEEIPMVLAKAFHIARTGRPGPVLVDITKDAQFEEFEYTEAPKVSLPSFQPTTEPNARQITLASELLNNAERPLMFIGHGIQIAHAEKDLMAFVEKSGIPVASTLLGLSSFPTGHKHYVGMLGMHGNYGPNLLSNQADVILAVGMRFDDRVTGNLDGYLVNAKVIHIDIDPAELNKNVKTEIPIVADAKIALQHLTPLMKKKTHTAWFQQFRDCDKKEYDAVISREINKPEEKIKMAEVIHTISEKTKGMAVIVADVGQHQMIAARYYRYKDINGWITSGGAGTMGFALPASVGAKIASPKRDVIAIIGDGAFQMNIQELGTIAQEKLPVKIVILNNEYLGMVRQWQELFFDNRYSFTHLVNPDFVAVAKGYGINGECVKDPIDLGEAIDRMLASKESYLLEVVVKTEQNVFPMVPSGARAHEIRLA